MNIAKLPETLTKPQVEALRNAFGYFYDEGKTSNFKDPKTGIRFKDPAEFIDELWDFGIPKETSIKHIGITLENWYENLSKTPEYAEPTMAGAPESEVQANIPQKGIREVQEQERVQRENSIKASVEKARRDVQTEIAHQEKLYAELEKYKRYVKVQKPEPQKLTLEEQKSIDALREAAKTSPKALSNQIEQTIKAKIETSVPKGTTPEEIEAISKQTAVGIVENLSGKSLAEDISITYAVSNQKTDLGIEDAKTTTELKSTAQRVFSEKYLSYDFERQVAASAFGEKFAENIYGPKNLDQIKIEFSSTQQNGFQDYNPSRISSSYSDSLKRDDLLLGNIKDFGVDKIKSQFTNSSIRWAESKLPEGFVEKALDNKVIQAALDIYGVDLGQATMIWEGTSPFGKLLVGSGNGPLAGWVSEFAGVDLGITGTMVGVGAGTFIAVSPTSTIATAAITTAVTEASLGSAGAVTMAGFGFEAAATTALVGAEAGVSTTAIGAAVGAAVPVPGLNVVTAAIGAFVATIIGPKAVGWVKDNASKIARFSFAGVGAAAGLILGGGTIGAVGSTLLGAGAGYGVGSLLTGGVPALQSSASSFVSGAGAAGGFVWQTFMAGVGTPILVTFLAFPIVVALILFIINSGAYVVPPGQSLLNSINPNIEVEKKASPEGPFDSPTSITYTITITAKKDALTIKDIKSECTVIKNDKSKIKCPDEKIPTWPATIVPGSPFSFTLTSNYDSKYQDALITNNITVSASLAEGTPITESGSASVCFGKCPLDCFDLNDPSWKAVSNLQSNLTSAASTLASSYPNFATKACAKGTIKLCYTTSDPSPMGSGGLCNSATYARHNHATCDINFNQCGIKNQSDALFILTHELTHHIQNINGAYQRQFNQQVPQSEWPVCSYNATGSSDSESMAEGNALFVSKPSWNSCVTNYANQYPKHYQFAKNVMFGK